MAFVDVLFGKSQDLRLAEANLIKREDEVFQVQDGEEADWKVHVRADVPRYQLLNARNALNAAMTRELSNRNLVITAFGMGMILAKLFGGFDLIWGVAKAAGFIH